MRIIAGEKKGRHLKTGGGMGTRPTSDKVKGAMFNVLGDKVLGARVLDLFAGSGNLALEALSRGAREAVLVEKNREAQQVIRKNIELMGFDPKVRIFWMDAFQYINKYSGEVFDLIFLDPPYREGLVLKTVELLKGSAYLTADGVIVVETAREEALGEDLEPFAVRKTGEYGDTKVWYLQRVAR